MNDDFLNQILESRKRMDLLYDKYMYKNIQIMAIMCISLLIILSYFVINYKDIIPTKNNNIVTEKVQ